MAAGLIAVILALISYFTAKKSGMSTGAAALTAAAVGAGSYYVLEHTETGQKFQEWIGTKTPATLPALDADGNAILDGNGNPILLPPGKPAFDADGEPIRGPDGAQITIPEGAQLVLDESGAPVRDPSGNVLWKLVDTAGNVLTGWGAKGTAGVIGAGAVASGKFDDYMPWIIGGAVGLGALVLLRR